MSRIFNDGTIYKTKKDEREELKTLTDKWVSEGNEITRLESKGGKIITYRAKASSK